KEDESNRINNSKRLKYDQFETKRTFQEEINDFFTIGIYGPKLKNILVALGAVKPISIECERAFSLCTKLFIPKRKISREKYIIKLFFSI
ncbi:MAG: hypothetical protein MHPSP_004910, partial [Paramarteilia canceri]